MKTIVTLGDSLTTGFFVSKLLPTALRIRRSNRCNWFVAQGSDINAVSQRNSPHTAVRYLNLARASARVCPIERSRVLDCLLGVRHFESQVQRWRRMRETPDITMIWLGHNDLDWVTYVDNSPTREFSSIKATLVKSFSDSFTFQLKCIKEKAEESKTRIVVIVFSLINFRYFFSGSE